MRILLSLFSLVIVSVLLASAQQTWPPSPHIAPTEPLPALEQLKKMHVPRGFEIQLVASEPDIDKPMNIAFDAAGRLWVTGSREYPFPAKSGKGRDTVRILSDFAPNGRARKIVTFADDLNIPIGILPFKNDALVFSIPSLYRMADTTGNGRADRRDVLFSGYGFKDTHGLTGEFLFGFDGWVYCCHGYANSSKVTGKGGKIAMQSGNTYRIKPDGSRIEHYTFGQVNPFGLAIDPAGNLYTSDCHSRPMYHLLRGAYYPSFGKPHDGLGFGPEMMTHDHGSTAIAGIACYAADDYPPEFQGNLFIGNVVTNRINRDRLEWHGSSPKAIDMPDFVRSDDPWFRPVDIKLGPDGALYVADFYNRIIGHYEVPLDHPGRDRERGRIWRIVYRGDKKQPREIKDLTQAHGKELIEALGDPNLTVRLHATHVLVERDRDGVIVRTKEAARSGTAFQKAHALWVLERVHKLDDDLLVSAANDPQRLVRVHALRILGERESWRPGDREIVWAGLKDSDALVQRAAADALGRHPMTDNIPYLVMLRHQVAPADTHLLHIVRMALRDQLKLLDGFAEQPFAVMKEADWRALADVCPGVHTPVAASFLLGHLQRWSEPAENLKRYAHAIARHGESGAGKKTLQWAREKRADDLGAQAAVFRATQQGLQERGEKLGEKERDWTEALTARLLADRSEDNVLAGIDFAQALKIKSMYDSVRKLSLDSQKPQKARRNALAALAAIDPARSVAPLARVLHDSGESFELREGAAQALAGINQPEVHEELQKALIAAPASLQRTLALGLAGSKAGGEKLLAAVSEGKASARLLQDRAVEVRLRQTGVPMLNERLAKLTAGLPSADKQVDALLRSKRESFFKTKVDVALGAKVFEKNCAACHQVQNKGSKIAPQLDGIGIRGLERLLEDIVDPNRNVDQAFRSTTLTLKTGVLVSGLVLRQEGQVVILADNQGKEVRIPAGDIAERFITSMSPMPANLADAVPQADFNHLLAFLLSQRIKN